MSSSSVRRTRVTRLTRLTCLTRVVQLGAVASLASAQLWCATNEDTPVPDSGTPLPEASAPDTQAPETSPPPAGPLTCSKAFCRVGVEGAEGTALNGVFARTASDVFLVGSAGFASHFDGTTWTRIATKTNASLFAAWGKPGGPLWGASAGTSMFILDRPVADGGVAVTDAGFSSVVTSLSGSSAGDTYAVGSVYQQDPFAGDPSDGDNIWRYGLPKSGDGGAAWRPVSPSCLFYGPTGCIVLRAVWSESATRQWFAGQDGKVYRTTTDAGVVDAGDAGDAGKDAGPSDRLRLEELDSSSLRTIEGLWGSGPNDIWAVGGQGSIRHYTSGTTWEIAVSPTTENLRAIWGSAANDVWAVGDGATVIHWDGATWSLVDVPFGDTNRPRFYSVSGTGRDVWVVGESTVLRSTAADGGAP